MKDPNDTLFPYFVGARVRATCDLPDYVNKALVAREDDLGTVETLDTGPLNDHLPAVCFDRTRMSTPVVHADIELLEGAARKADTLARLRGLSPEKAGQLLDNLVEFTASGIEDMTDEEVGEILRDLGHDPETLGKSILARLRKSLAQNGTDNEKT